MDYNPLEAAFQNATEIDGDEVADAEAARHGSERLVKSKNGQVLWCVATAIAIFEHHPDWKGFLRHDTFLKKDMLYRAIPGSDEDASSFPREITDADIVNTMVWCNRNGFASAKQQTILDAFHKIANENRTDQLAEMLDALKWDRVPRLSSMLVTYFGAEDCTFNLEVSRRWMISAVARALSPGCKADACLVLEGGQGGGKSSALRILAGDEFFGDALPDLANKDAPLYLRGKWIVELSELASLNKSSFEQTKAFVSRQEEQYRPPYGRLEVTEPRRCVFAGTTNRDDYLRDPTGNRRFWPVATGVIDLEGLQRDRDQLWAEAVRAYTTGEPWWLTGKAAELASEAQSERGEDDPWIAIISAYCDGKEMVSCKSILDEALAIPQQQMTQRDSKRVAALLLKINYRRDGKFTSGDKKGQVRFVRSLPNKRK